MEKGGGQRVLFKCKYCKVMFDTAITLVAHKRFEHADQIFGKSPNNNKTDWDPIRSSDEKSPTKIQINSRPVFSAKTEPHERSGPSAKVYKMPGISSKRNSDENTRLKCRFCPMTLASTEKLREHERIHTGEKPYQCQHCLKGFAEKSAAESHEKKCPVLDILKSEVKKEKNKRSNVPKIPLKNGFKTKAFAQSGSACKNNNSYLKKRLSYTRNFPCSVCNQNFKNAWSLSRHKKAHEASHPKTRNTTDYFPILKTENVPFLPQLVKCIGSQGEVNYSCQKCNRRLLCKASGSNHLHTHFGKYMFTCPICNKQFPSMKQVVEHFHNYPTSSTSNLEDATAISEYVTRYFKLTQASERNQDTADHFTEEEDLDNDRKIFKCKQCDYKAFSTAGMGRHAEFRQRMRCHIRRKHTRTNLYHCDHCHRGYAVKAQLRNHRCKRKPGEAVTVVKIEGFQCPVCAIVFDSQELLAVHNDGHSKMPFLCVKCGLWFRRAQDIKAHLVDCAK